MDVIIVVAVVGAFWERLLTQDDVLVVAQFLDKVTSAFLLFRAIVPSIGDACLLSPFVLWWLIVKGDVTDFELFDIHLFTSVLVALISWFVGLLFYQFVRLSTSAELEIWLELNGAFIDWILDYTLICGFLLHSLWDALVSFLSVSVSSSIVIVISLVVFISCKHASLSA